MKIILEMTKLVSLLMVGVIVFSLLPTTDTSATDNSAMISNEEEHIYYITMAMQIMTEPSVSRTLSLSENI